MIAQAFTLGEYAVAFWLVLALALLLLHALVDLSRFFTRERTPTVDVDVDVQAVIAESLHVHNDPLAPEQTTQRRR